jgi:tripartite-type tricarboxylate transporter receptor subunit TctC
MISRRHLLLSTTVCALPLALHAQTTASKPVIDKPVRILVGFPPGGSADLMARALSLHMADYAAQVIVENKAGAGGRIALDTLKSADPDGSTLVVTPSSMLTIYPHVYKQLNYNPQKDFSPVASMASFPIVLVVGPMVPTSVKTLADFLAWCKANPGQAAYATPGGGTTPHFAGAALARASGVDLLHVPYKGGAPAMTDVMGGQIAANMAVISNAMPLLKSGKIRAIAVTGAQRATALPQVPTIVESGFPDVVVSEWFAVLLPAKANPAHVARLNLVVQEAMKSQAMKEVLAKAAFDGMAPVSPTQLTQLMNSDLVRWGQIVKATGYTPQD